MTWDTVLVVVVVAACAGLLGRRLFRQLRGKGSCGCSCGSGGCPAGRPTGPDCGCPPEAKK
ncbi:MAG: hypothetical protein ACOY8P_05815 [Thermodesulfobacteriota bacterium]